MPLSLNHFFKILLVSLLVFSCAGPKETFVSCNNKDCGICMGLGYYGTCQNCWGNGLENYSAFDSTSINSACHVCWGSGKIRCGYYQKKK